jgi:hypothetical protein
MLKMNASDTLKEIDSIKNQLIEKYRPEKIKERLELGDPFIRKIFKDGKVLY